MIKFATVNLKEIVTVLKGYSDEYSAFAEPRFGSIVEFSDELIEMIDSKKKNEKEAVIYAYNQIINICQEIGNAKLARDYKDSLEEYKRSNIIVTKATSESSKSSTNDNLPIL